MKRVLMSCLIAAFMPGAALAHGNIDVRVSLAGGPGWESDETWIEFEAERDAFVAVYATFSDGSFELVFPGSPGESHWVDGWARYAVPVLVPYGVRLENVQAVASAQWFDPSECWLAFDDGYDWHAPRVMVAAAWPVWSWGFSFAWSQPARCWTEVRRIDWYAPRCDWVDRGAPRFRSWDRWDDRRVDRYAQVARTPSAGKGRHVVKGETRRQVRKEVATRTEARVAPRKHAVAKAQGAKRDVVKSRSTKQQVQAKSSSVRSTEGGSRKRVETAHGKKSSTSRRNSGEPKRRLGR